MIAQIRMLPQRLFKSAPRVYGFLLAVAFGTAAAFVILLYDVPHQVAKNFPKQRPELHLPLYTSAGGLAILVAIFSLFVIALAHSLTKIRALSG